MRHAIGLLAVILSIAISSRAAEPGADTSSCPRTLSTSEPALQQQYAEFRQSIESAPFARRLGSPLACAVRAEGGSVWLEYKYAKGGKLEAHRDSAIELTEQRLTKAGLYKTTALILLQRTERWAFDGKGCGIAWKKAPAREPGATPDSHDLAYRGADCNCQGRLEYNGAALTGLVFRSTC
jgi:hypothetical protein